MKFRLDHVVIAVGDLARTVADYRELGFTVQMGGRHPGRTSQNALVVFEDGAYLELIAWPEPGTAERWYNVHTRHGDGLIDFALIPDDVPQAISEAKARGLALNGPIDGGRVRPDGRELEWQTGRQATFDLPFLCGDITPRDLRVPTGPVRRHANAALGVATVAVAVFDLETSLARYVALLGLDSGAGAIVPAVLPGGGIRLACIGLGNTAIILVTPSTAGSEPPSALAREVRERLAKRGEGPCGLVIRTSARHGATLDRATTHEVLLEMDPVTG